MRLSPATVIASTALLLSLGGNALAVRGLITSKDIKNGSIQLVDLSPTTRSALASTAVRRNKSAGEESITKRVERLEGFRARLCLNGVVSDARLVGSSATAVYTLNVTKNPCF